MELPPPPKRSKGKTPELDPVDQVRAESALLSKLSTCISELRDCDLGLLRTKKLDKLTGTYVIAKPESEASNLDAGLTGCL